jgi:hypothetical protein
MGTGSPRPAIRAAPRSPGEPVPISDSVSTGEGVR